MALQKQSLPINFSQGLDTKSDPLQVTPGKFLSLKNSVFNKAGRLTKRNGYGKLASLPDSSSVFLTTFKDNLTAIGTSFNAYSSGSNSWVNKGSIQPLELDTQTIIRSNTNQSQSDSAVSDNDLICTVFTDNIPSAGSAVPSYKYVITDAITGQNIVAPTLIPVSSGVVTGSPKVFFLGRYFIIVFTNVITAVNHLQYIAINITSPTTVIANTDISNQYTPATTVAWDGCVVNNNLYLAWNGNDGGAAIRMTYIDSALTQYSTVTFTGRTATIMSVCADTSQSTAVIYASFFNSGSSTGYTLAVDQQLGTVLAPTQIISTGTILNITSSAANGVCTVLYELSNNYSYDSAIPSHFIRYRTITQAGTLGTATVAIRSLGLASKAFLYDGTIYFLGIYYSVYQPTYFLCSSTGAIIAKLAYSNAGTYYTLGLPNVSLTGNVAKIPYQFKDLIQAVNKTQGATSNTGIYSQTGVNLATFTIGTSNISTAEIGNDLHLSGGFLWMYDGYVPVEHGFHLWPDNVEVTTATTGGLLIAQDYYYVATYEWSDNQGNIFRSAPSIPVKQTTTGSTSANTVNIPTLRVTAKTANPVKIVVYRWSTAQQTYYQVTSLTVPTLNSTTTDSVAFLDTRADTAIIGNSILYTTGGVIENIGAPAISSMTLYQSRLFAVDAEDKNLIWFSKQVIEATPVEMSDLLTIYVAPTIGGQGSTGDIKVLSSMDDKLIMFKKNAIYYMTGSGPDNTGANNQYTDPVFITSTVGCSNQQSIVFMPNGLMFQSDKGIWLLGRDLSTSYIGAPVEEFNEFDVQSAVNVPGTNQVRFTLSNGVTLMYDYFYGQWGTFVNVPAISSTLYQGMHTYINSSGLVYQETEGKYLDGSNPVLMSFTTSWLNLAGLQGFERAYFFYIIGTYYSPHKLAVQIAYDYNPSATQLSVITPDNYVPNYGGEQLWGSGGPWGGSNLEQHRVFLQQQKCQAFQISINEYFDSSLGAPAGAGLSISGLDLVVGMKGSYPKLKAAKSVG